MHRRVKVEEEAEHPISTRMELDDASLAYSTASIAGQDEVVREIDVYLSPELSQQLYLLQYPGQHESSAVATPASARIKPRHGILEAEHPAFRNATRTYQSQTIPVTTHLCLGKLMPSPPPPAAAAAAVTAVKCESFTVAAATAATTATTENDVLHLIPLTHITQMRPSFQHLIEDDDHNDEEEAAAAPTNDDGGDVNKKPIAFQRKESERAAAARKSSYAFKKASQEAEAWIDLTVVPAATAANVFGNNNNPKKTSQLDYSLGPNEKDFKCQTTRNAVWQKIVCPDPLQSIWDDDATLHDANNSSSNNNNRDGDSDASYVQSLNYLSSSSSSTDPAGAATVSASSGNTGIDAKTIVTKLIALLQSGGPIPYSVLRGQFVVAAAAAAPTSITEESLLSALNVCAVLCRGNWCLHSNFLALSDSMKQVRTFLLLLFQSKGLIRRSRLLRVYSSSITSTDVLREKSSSNSDSSRSSRSPIAVTPERLLSLLKLIAKQTRDGWVVKIDDDIKFIDQHPVVRALHNTYWERQRTRFARELQVYDQDDRL